MTKANSDSLEFCHKQTWFGIVLMVREAIPADGYGTFDWSKWRKAGWYTYEIFMGE